MALFVVFGVLVILQQISGGLALSDAIDGDEGVGYPCFDGREISADMEFQCVEMHITETEYNTAKRSVDSTQSSVFSMLEALSLGFQGIFSDSEVVDHSVKQMHTHGIILPISWKLLSKKFRKKSPVPNYSGLFASGGKGFLRLSLANHHPDALSPPPSSSLAAAIKIYRDQKPSGNLLFLPSDGANPNSTGYFSENLTNRPLTNGEGDLVRAGVGGSFSRLSSYPFHAGTSNFALYDKKGHTDGDSILFPFEIQLVPSRTLRKLSQKLPIPEESSENFLRNLQTSISTVISEIPEKGKLFDVVANQAPQTSGNCTSGVKPLLVRDCGWVRIGSIHSKGKAVASAYSDGRMRFAHTRFEADLKYPSAKEWVEALKNTETWQAGIFHLAVYGLSVVGYKSLQYAEKLSENLSALLRKLGLTKVEEMGAEDSTDAKENPHPWMGMGTEEDCPYMKALNAQRELEEAQKQG
ncbi:hypothetical protein AAMO2058_001086400 [Amorphochlora amoebiformis]